MLEVSAEIAGGGETELEGGLLDCLLGMRVHDAFLPQWRCCFLLFV